MIPNRSLQPHLPAIVGFGLFVAGLLLTSQTNWETAWQRQLNVMLFTLAAGAVIVSIAPPLKSEKLRLQDRLFISVIIGLTIFILLGRFGIA
jgi:hypothetical protein